MPPSLIGDWAKSQTQTVSQKAFQEFRKYDSGSGVILSCNISDGTITVSRTGLRTPTLAL